MAEVIYLTQQNAIAPKSISGMHMAQRYMCTFDPNAPIHEQWVWQVDLVRTYKYFGAAASLERAQKKAKAKIRELVEFHQQLEERE